MNENPSLEDLHKAMVAKIRFDEPPHSEAHLYEMGTLTDANDLEHSAWIPIAESEARLRARFPAIPAESADRRTLIKRERAFEETGKSEWFESVLACAVELFEDECTALDWLSEPDDSFGGLTALQMLRTKKGAKSVEQRIGAILYGLYL